MVPCHAISHRAVRLGMILYGYVWLGKVQSHTVHDSVALYCTMLERMVNNWTLDKEKICLRNIYANIIGDNSSSISALFKAEKWLSQSVIE